MIFAVLAASSLTCSADAEFGPLGSCFGASGSLVGSFVLSAYPRCKTARFAALASLTAGRGLATRNASVQTDAIDGAEVILQCNGLMQCG